MEVTLALTDSGALYDTVTATITVGNAAPAVTIPAGQGQTLELSGIEGDSISFPADFTNDDPWDTHTANIDWGDGTTEAAASGDDSGTGWAIGSHVYGHEGVYDAVLTITDSGGLTATQTAAITILNAPPLADRGYYVRTLTNQAVSFAGGYTDPGTGDTYTYAWTVRDSSDNVISTGTNQAFSWTPDTADTYTATFTVTDDGLLSGTTTFTILVLDTDNDTITPDAPSDLSVDSVSPDGVTLNWTDNSDNEDGFLIEWALGGDYYAIDVVNPNTTTYTDFYPVLNSTNHYRIRSYRGDNESAPTDYVTAVPNTPPVNYDDENGGFTGRNTLSPYSVVHDHELSLDQLPLVDWTTMTGDDVPTTILGDAGRPMHVASLTSPHDGHLEYRENGTKLFYIPRAGFVGTDEFEYTLTDDQGNVGEPAVVKIDVTNQAPLAQSMDLNPDLWWDNVVNGHHNVAQGQVQAGDADGDAVTYSIVRFPICGEIISFDSTTGEFAYAPYSSFNGYDSFAFVANDGLKDSAPAIVTIQSGALTAGNTVIYLLKNTTNGRHWPYTTTSGTEGVTSQLTVITPPQHGTFSSLWPDIYYTPADNWTGVDTVQCVASSGDLTTPKPITIEYHVINSWDEENLNFDVPYQTSFYASADHTTVVSSAQANFIHKSGVTVRTLNKPLHGDLTLRPDGYFEYTLTDHEFRGWDYFSFQYSGVSENKGPNWICLRVGYNVPNNPAPPSIWSAPDFPASFYGILAGYNAADKQLREVGVNLQVLGHLIEEFNQNEDDYTEAQYGLYEDRLVACWDDLKSSYGHYIQTLLNVTAAATEFQKHVWVLEEAESSVLMELMSLPVDVAGIHPTQEQSVKLAQAFASFGAGSGIMISHAGTVVNTAKWTGRVLDGILIVGSVGSGGVFVLSAERILARKGATP